MRGLVLVAAVVVLATTASAQVFSDNFDDLGGAGRWSSPFFSSELNPPALDGLVDYAFDYSTLGIAPAPNSAGTTIGLGFQVNNTDDPVDEGEAIGVSPLIANLPDNYTITADVFIYFNGTGGGSSENATIGINSDQSGVPFLYKPQGTGVTYSIPHNSGLTSTVGDDYARGVDGTWTALYGNHAGGIDPATLNIPFVGVDPIFDDPGYAGNRWFSLELSNINNIVTISIEGVVIDQYDNTAGTTAGDIVVGLADNFNSANPNNWGIWDNFVVTPEPASLVLLALSALAVRRR
jgi:hypothetical protein